jgi:hypothetical protein
MCHQQNTRTASPSGYCVLPIYPSPDVSRNVDRPPVQALQAGGRQGFDALMAGRDHVIGAGRATWGAGVMHKFLPEHVKAHRQAKQARPS